MLLTATSLSRAQEPRTNWITTAPAAGSPDSVQISGFQQPVPGIEVAAVSNVSTPDAQKAVVAQLLAELGKYPSLNATVAVEAGGDGATHLLVAGRPDALEQNHKEGVYGVMARLCAAPEIKAAAAASPQTFSPPTEVEGNPNVYDIRLPGTQTADSVAQAMQDGMQVNETQQLQTLLNGLPQGKRVALLIGGPSGAGKSTLIASLQKMSPGRKIVYFSGDMYFRDINDPNYPKTKTGDFFLDSPNAMHMDEMAADIAQLIQTGSADLPDYDFTKVPPGGPIQGYTGMRVDKANHVTLGPDDILVIDSLHATNPAVINQLTTMNLPHASVYLDSPSANMRLIRRMVRDFVERSGSADRTLAAWDLTTFPGERDFIRPTLLQLDPAEDLVYETQFPADVDLSRDEINHKVALLDKYGLTPTYPAFKTPDDQFPQFVVSERKRLGDILASNASADDKKRAQQALDMLNQANGR